MRFLPNARLRRAGAFSLPGLLLIKAGAFALAWFVFPFWVSFALALYFYFIPFFHVSRLLFPFLLMLALAAWLPLAFWFAAMLGAIFFLILGIKNLIFVNRFGNHQFLAFLILFLIEFSFFSSVEHWSDWRTPFWSLGIAIVFFLMTRALFGYLSGESSRADFVSIGTGALLAWQIALGILFLPFNPLYQTALLFLTTVIVEDLLLERARSLILDPRKLLTDFSIFFLLASFILASAEWTL